MTGVSDKCCRENQYTHFMFHKFFLKTAVCDNVVKYVTAQQAADNNVIQRAHFSCQITKNTDTRS
jgi:hypothetical protein